MVFIRSSEGYMGSINIDPINLLLTGFPEWAINKDIVRRYGGCGEWGFVWALSQTFSGARLRVRIRGVAADHPSP